MMVSVNTLHCKQSTYNLRQVGVLAKRIHDPLTKKRLADRILSRHALTISSPEITRSVNHALKALEDERRV